MPFSDLSSLSSSSDEEEIPVRRIRLMRNRNNPFEMYDEVDFKYRFRLSKENVVELLEKFAVDIAPATARNKSIDAMTQLLITLRFYATGSFQRVIGDHIHVHQSTVCRIVKRVTHCIAMQARDCIKMPTGDEIPKVVRDFYRLRGFPKVIGALDCTHIKIQSPGGNNAEMFRNRKGVFSINVQAVCDASLKIRHLIARWPGSVHDSTIFNDCPLIPEFEAGQYGVETYLLGDSGYPCKKYLLTPLLHPHTPAEHRYNRAHVATRNPIERTFGVLKRRFPCLTMGLRSKNTNFAIIVACCVLHNFAIEAKEDIDFLGDIPIEDQVNFNVNFNNENTAVRTALIRTVFTN